MPRIRMPARCCSGARTRRATSKNIYAAALYRQAGLHTYANAVGARRGRYFYE